MPTADVIMPKMGDGMESGTLLSWKKRDGDQVKSGEIIAEIETDKSNVEIEAEDSGVLRTQVTEGQSVPVGAVIATIGDGARSAAPPASKPAPAATAAPASAAPAHAPVAHSARNGGSADRIKASPLARRIARERGVVLDQLRGSGPNGRIIEADVVAATGAATARPSSPPAARPVPTVATPTAAGEVREMSTMRKVIARRMVESATQIPAFYVTSEIEMDAAVDLRKQLNSYDEGLAKISINDMIVRACALALTKVPEVNRIFHSEGRYLQPASANVGIAVALDDGLIVPVVKDANAKPLRAIAREAHDLIDKARGKRLQPGEYSGGTFTVSNLGASDVDSFIAIIDPSQGAILAVGSSRKTPVVLSDDTVAVRQRMKVTLSGDHRVMDGATGAKFLQELKRLLQSPLSLLEG